MHQLSSFSREQVQNEMATSEFDIVIIGGGITGAGIALDAASRGMKVALIEMQDFAAGTSSRSTKLIHGGLRYLQQLELKLVADVGKERAIVYENGPHVTTPEWMLLPFHQGSNLGPIMTRIGLTLYDLLAGVHRTERKKMLSKTDALAMEPLIKEEELKGAGYYVEYKTDDARLTLEVMKKAVEYGAVAVNYTKATGFDYDGDQKLSGVQLTDQFTGKTFKVNAKKVINATGPWVDTLREKDGSKSGKTLLLTKGVHLVFDQSVFPLQQAVYFDTPDKRMIFAIPREGKTYVGTTDTVFDGEIAKPTATKDDRDYILKAIKYMFPILDIKPSDIVSSWAGLRPLIREEGKDNPSDISRKDEIFISPSGLISIAGGKLTGYRKMAEHIVDTVAKQLKDEVGVLYSDSETKRIPISGGEVGGAKGFKDFIVTKTETAEKTGIPTEEAKRLIKRYGSNIDTLVDYYSKYQFEAVYRRINPSLFAELIYAMECEAAYTPSDFFVRRTGVLFFDIDKVKAEKNAVIDYMAEKLDMSETLKATCKEDLNKQIEAATLFPQN